MVGQINPTELLLNKANYSDTEAPFSTIYIINFAKPFLNFIDDTII